MKRLMNVLDHINRKIVLFAYCTVIILGFTQVISRYVFSIPIVWVEEASKYLFIWLTFPASALCVMAGMHIRVDAVINLFPKKMNRPVEVMSRAFTIVFSGVFTYYIISMMQISSADRSATTNMPLAYVYLGMFIGGILITVNYIRAFFAYLSKKNQNEETKLPEGVGLL